MNDFIDNVSRILATPMPRRKAMKLFGGAFAAAVVAFAGGQTAEAACKAGQVTCGTGAGSTCCKSSSCCYGTNGKSCCSGFLQSGTCLKKKPASGNYATC